MYKFLVCLLLLSLCRSQLVDDLYPSGTVISSVLFSLDSSGIVTEHRKSGIEPDLITFAIGGKSIITPYRTDFVDRHQISCNLIAIKYTSSTKLQIKEKLTVPLAIKSGYQVTQIFHRIISFMHTTNQWFLDGHSLYLTRDIHPIDSPPFNTFHKRNDTDLHYDCSLIYV